ncbi:MAG: ATP-binding protein, partial [Chloroflexota bacterium]
PCESPIAIRGDAARLGQALGNLLSNALQYAPANSEVTVRCTVNGNVVITDVIDRGAGISPDDLPHIFERFYRADRARQRMSGGRGLGLSIVKQIIEGHGGQVGVESAVGRGSRFRYTLPLDG